MIAGLFTSGVIHPGCTTFAFGGHPIEASPNVSTRLNRTSRNDGHPTNTPRGTVSCASASVPGVNITRMAVFRNMSRHPKRPVLSFLQG